MEWIGYLSGWRLPTWPHMHSNSYSLPHLYNPLDFSQTMWLHFSRTVGTTSLCRGWRLHRLNWTHCNYSTPWYCIFSKMARCWHYFMVAPPSERKWPSQRNMFWLFPTWGALAVTISLLMMGMMRMMTTVVVAAAEVIMPSRNSLTFHEIWLFAFLLRVRWEDQYHHSCGSWKQQASSV